MGRLHGHAQRHRLADLFATTSPTFMCSTPLGNLTVLGMSTAFGSRDPCRFPSTGRSRSRRQTPSLVPPRTATIGAWAKRLCAHLQALQAGRFGKASLSGQSLRSSRTQSPRHLAAFELAQLLLRPGWKWRRAAAGHIGAWHIIFWSDNTFDPPLSIWAVTFLAGSR